MNYPVQNLLDGEDILFNNLLGEPDTLIWQQQWSHKTSYWAGVVTDDCFILWRPKYAISNWLKIWFDASHPGLIHEGTIEKKNLE